MRISNQVFLVTGGSSGLGLATALELAGLGARLVVVDIDAASGRRRIEALGADARFVEADITREDQARRAVACAVQTFGAVHGLINCAGIAPVEKLLGRHGPHGLDSFRRVLEVNLVGSFNMLRLASEAMAQGLADGDGERGVIINTASVAAFEGQVGQAAYAASKGGVAALTLPLARELARSGIRVMCIAPGIFETPMMADMPQQVRDALTAEVPFPARLGRPQEYAALARHIIENPMLNGEVIRLDGALRMAAR